MLNRNKTAKEAARVLLGLSMSAFDGEDAAIEDRSTQKRLQASRGTFLVMLAVIVASLGAWALALWCMVRP